MLTIYVLSKNKKTIKKFPLKIFNFYNFKNLCLLHGQVYVMENRAQITSVTSKSFYFFITMRLKRKDLTSSERFDNGMSHIYQAVSICWKTSTMFGRYIWTKYIWGFKNAINNLKQQFIMKTSPCYVYPLEPHFYIVKLGFAGVYLFFLFLLQNVDCGYSLEPAKNKKNIRKFPLKIFIFYNFKNLCLLHGQVFVMKSHTDYFSHIEIFLFLRRLIWQVQKLVRQWHVSYLSSC